MKRKICAITSSRADYGILKPLLKRIESDEAFDLVVVATGTHLDKNFGYTITEIEKENFAAIAKIPSRLTDTSANAINHAIGNLIAHFSNYYSTAKPDLVLVLGDRYEVFAATIAAYVLQIPIAHIHGGEVSAGAFDEGFRHSITKLSALHFVICEEYRNRVIQLGENPKTVFNVGALVVDNIQQEQLLSKSELENILGISLKSPSALITYHPVTLEKNTSLQHLQNLLEALNHFPEMNLVFNKSNADTDGEALNKAIEAFVATRKNGVLVDSLGTQKFLSTLKNVSMMIGNSSAGIIEMPYFKHPTINIGDRQKGRHKAAMVIDCDTSVLGISKAILKARNNAFLKNTSKDLYPFGKGNTANKIIELLQKNLPTLRLKKGFYDL